jgi:hypothetical protein
MKEIQTHFVTTISPAHHGNQGKLHQDVHQHLAGPDNKIIGPPIAQQNHVPLTGQTTLNDFSLQITPGLPKIGK